VKQAVFTLIICSHNHDFLSCVRVILAELHKSSVVFMSSVISHNHQTYVEEYILHFAEKIYVWKLPEKYSQAIHAFTIMALRWIIHNPDQTDGCVPRGGIDSVHLNTAWPT